MQSAVNVVYDINRRRVIVNVCRPYNVLVDKHSQTPFTLSLAECWFKDESIEMWENIEN